MKLLRFREYYGLFWLVSVSSVLNFLKLKGFFFQASVVLTSYYFKVFLLQMCLCTISLYTARLIFRWDVFSCTVTLEPICSGNLWTVFNFLSSLLPNIGIFRLGLHSIWGAGYLIIPMCTDKKNCRIFIINCYSNFRRLNYLWETILLHRFPIPSDQQVTRQSQL